MAALAPDKQTIVDMKDGTLVSITKVTLINASGDTVDIPPEAYATAGESVGILNDAGASGTGVTISAADQQETESQNTRVTINSGVVGEQYTIVGMHVFTNTDTRIALGSDA